jgi:hypothetical protein
MFYRDSETWRVVTNPITSFNATNFNITNFDTANDTEKAKPIWIKLISYRFPTCKETEDYQRHG